MKMRYGLLVLFVFLVAVPEAEAIGRRRRVRGNYYTSTTGYNTSLYGAKRIDPSTQKIAQFRANEMARMNRWGHFWSGFGRGWAEGVGSGSSPQAACSSCCDFNGTIIAQATAQSASGTWYACTIYGN